MSAYVFMVLMMIVMDRNARFGRRIATSSVGVAITLLVIAADII